MSKKRTEIAVVEEWTNIRCYTKRHDMEIDPDELYVDMGHPTGESWEIKTKLNKRFDRVFRVEVDLDDGQVLGIEYKDVPA
jgi:hypothetical protein